MQEAESTEGCASRSHSSRPVSETRPRCPTVYVLPSAPYFPINELPNGSVGAAGSFYLTLPSTNFISRKLHPSVFTFFTVFRLSCSLSMTAFYFVLRSRPMQADQFQQNKLFRNCFESVSLTAQHQINMKTECENKWKVSSTYHITQGSRFTMMHKWSRIIQHPEKNIIYSTSLLLLRKGKIKKNSKKLQLDEL